MPRTTSKAIRWIATWTIALVFVLSAGLWLVRRDSLLRTVRIAAGESGGLYDQLATALQPGISERIGRPVEIRPTQGSVDNLDMLRAGEVDLAVLQGGSVPMDQVAVVSPLFPELVLIIVRKESGLRQIAELAGRKIAIAPEGAGSRDTALRVLRHFEIEDAELVSHRRYIRQLIEDPTIDAVIATAGIGHQDLQDVLASGEFHVLPIGNAEAIDMLHPYLHSTEVPRGLFCGRPPVPETATPTIATTAYLVARDDSSDTLIRAALAAVHEDNLRLAIPTLIPRDEASRRVPTRFHPVAQRYFNPADDIGYMANVMESLAATKELLFALGAGIYLLWLRYRRLKARETQDAFSRQKEHLDLMLEQTLRIEERHMRSTDANDLHSMMDDVTRIKLKALHEFTEEELRGDQAFSIFLTQCANLINEIQLKIISLGPIEE